MLDYLLIRPKDRQLWTHNQPEALHITERMGLSRRLQLQARLWADVIENVRLIFMVRGMLASDEIQGVSARLEMTECELLGSGSAESGAAAMMHFKTCFMSVWGCLRVA